MSCPTIHIQLIDGDTPIYDMWTTNHPGSLRDGLLKSIEWLLEEVEEKGLEKIRKEVSDGTG